MEVTNYSVGKFHKFEFHNAQKMGVVSIRDKCLIGSEVGVIFTQVIVIYYILEKFYQ